MAIVGKVIPKCEMILYILNGLGPRYLTFVTTFNMTQVKPYVGVLYNQLENFERMLLHPRVLFKNQSFKLMQLVLLKIMAIINLGVTRTHIYEKWTS